MYRFSCLASARWIFLLRFGLIGLAVLLPLSSVVETRSTNAPAISISFCDVPLVLPSNTGLSTYSPELCFGYSGLGQQVYTLKAWLLETVADPCSFCCASTQWCERVFTIDNSTGQNSTGTIVVVQNMDVHNYSSFLWVARLFDQAGLEVAPHIQQAASSTMNRAPVLNPIGNKIGTVGGPLQFNVSASDAEGDVLDLSAQNLPPGATFTPATGVFNWSSPVAGAYSSIIFKATQAGAIPLGDAELISIQVGPSNQTLALSSSSYTAGEGGPAIVIVNRTGGSVGTVTVQYATANITAVSGSDCDIRDPQFCGWGNHEGYQCAPPQRYHA